MKQPPPSPPHTSASVAASQSSGRGTHAWPAVLPGTVGLNIGAQRGVPSPPRSPPPPAHARAHEGLPPADPRPHAPASIRPRCPGPPPSLAPPFPLRSHALQVRAGGADSGPAKREARARAAPRAFVRAHPAPRWTQWTEEPGPPYLPPRGRRGAGAVNFRGEIGRAHV